MNRETTMTRGGIRRSWLAMGKHALVSYLVLSLSLSSLLPAATPSRAADAARRGQTSTPLPDGRVLTVGGEDAGGVTSRAAVIVDRGVATPVPDGLAEGRSWHTATMLADGRVLIHGGLGSNRRVVVSSELFDPVGPSFGGVATGLSPRAHHSATTLTDGQVLVVGGVSPQGDTLPTAELWDPRTSTITVIEAQLQTPRSRHTAMLLPDGRVLISDGVDGGHVPVTGAEIFDPDSLHFESADDAPVDDAGSPTALNGSEPASGAVNVPVDPVVGLRFSRPLGLPIKAEDVAVASDAGVAAATVVPAESGRLLFVRPLSPLLGGTRYRLTIHNLRDASGLPVAPFEIEFTTAVSAAANTAGPELVPAGNSPGDATPSPDGSGMDWTPSERNFHGDWRTGWPPEPRAAQPPLQAPPGVTALAGARPASQRPPVAERARANR